METVTDEYVFFAIACLVIAVVMLRLLLRERITLQGSMSYLAFLTLLGLMAVFPHLTGRVAQARCDFGRLGHLHDEAAAALARRVPAKTRERLLDVQRRAALREAQEQVVVERVANLGIEIADVTVHAAAPEHGHLADVIL